jgi:fumarate reductase subunit C
MTETSVLEETRAPNYSKYHPRWYRPRVSVYWWLGQWRYLRFVLRELSSVFVAIAVIMTLLQLRALRAGPDAYVHLQQQLRTPLVVFVSTISLFFVLFHTITWFNLTPRAMPVKLQGKLLPEWMVAAPNYALWIVLSVTIAVLILRGRS